MHFSATILATWKTTRRLQSFEQGVEHFEKLFRVKAEAIAYDLHPNYLATRYALERAQADSLTSIGVQHHHAHVAACMAEHGLDGTHPIIGVAFDGTGYGEDGAIWGGEFLVADYQVYKRICIWNIFHYPEVMRRSRACAHCAGIAMGFGLEWDAQLAAFQEFCAEEHENLSPSWKRNQHAADFLHGTLVRCRGSVGGCTSKS